MAVVSPTDRPKSVHNRCVIELFCGVVCVVFCRFDISVGEGAFVIGLSQISSFFFSYIHVFALECVHRATSINYINPYNLIDLTKLKICFFFFSPVWSNSDFHFRQALENDTEDGDTPAGFVSKFEKYILNSGFKYISISR